MKKMLTVCACLLAGVAAYAEEWSEAKARAFERRERADVRGEDLVPPGRPLTCLHARDVHRHPVAAKRERRFARLADIFLPRHAPVRE